MPIPIGEQTKGQIVLRISVGELQASDRLPSLRELARSLDVSYATLSYVYSDLCEEGLVRTEPGKGTYVADLRQIHSRASSSTNEANLMRLVDVLIGQASLLGFTPAQIREGVLSRLADYRTDSKVCHVALVGMSRRATDSYAREIEELLRDQNVKVKPILLQDLRADPEKEIGAMMPAKMIISIPTAFQEVCGLVKSTDLRVAAIAFQTSKETRRKLAAIGPGHRVGVIATEPRYLQILVQEVAPYISSGAAMPYAVRGDERAIESLAGSVDAVVYHSGCEECLVQFPDTVEAIEYLYSPVPESVLRLTTLLTDEVCSLEPSGSLSIK